MGKLPKLADLVKVGTDVSLQFIEGRFCLLNYYCLAESSEKSFTHYRELSAEDVNRLASEISQAWKERDAYPEGLVGEEATERYSYDVKRESWAKFFAWANGELSDKDFALHLRIHRDYKMTEFPLTVTPLYKLIREQLPVTLVKVFVEDYSQYEINHSMIVKLRYSDVYLRIDYVLDTTYSRDCEEITAIYQVFPVEVTETQYKSSQEK